ncbi:transposase family protein [Streptomyces mirabilis]
MQARGLIMSERRVTGLSTAVIADLVAELGPIWQARRNGELLDRPRRRAVGVGAKYKLVFVDRLLATLVHLRHGVTHDVLACWFQVDRSTITRAVGEIRPLLADRGCRIEGGLRLRALADVITYLGATGQTALMDATEIRVRRPSAHRGGRSRFISGKSRINAMKALVVTDQRGRPLFCGEVRAGSVADITQARDAGLVDLLAPSRSCRGSVCRRRPGRSRGLGES